MFGIITGDKMKIDRKELLNILEQVKPGISAKELVESMTHLFFSGENLITYNDVISIQYPFITDFNLFVKAKDFFNLLTKAATVENVNLSEKDGKLVVTSKKFRASLSTISDEEIKIRINTVSESLKTSKWKILPDNFCSSISLCSFTASKQETDGTLACVYLDKKLCVSSDNNRISQTPLTSDVDKMFINASEIKNLVLLCPVEYSVTKSWIHFKNEEDCIFSLRKIEGEFPDFLQFFDFKGITIELPKEIMEGVDLTSIFLNDDNPSINIKIGKNQCMLSIKSTAGSIQHKTKFNYAGDEFSFSINPEFLKEMMKHSTSILFSKDKIKLQTDNGFSLVTVLYA